jgi:hypothetical protein
MGIQQAEPMTPLRVLCPIVALIVPFTAKGQRFIPDIGQWELPSEAILTQGTELIPGQVANVTGTLGVGQTSDSGYFRYRDAGEGDDFRVCVN